MSDLISRQDAIDAIEEIRSCIWDVDIPSPTVPEYIEHHKQMQELMDRCDTLRNNLVNLPPAERKHGEWIKFDEGDCYCSNCGIALEDWVQGIFYKFCPYCGARMDEDDDNDDN